jgi:hypothetical protein
MRTSQQNTSRSPLRKSRALTVVLLAACGQFSLGGSAIADGKTPRKGSSSSGPSSAPPSGSAHDTFSVLDVKIGTPVDRAGFTCAKEKGKDPQDRHCVKFVDSRCSGQPANIGELKYGEKAPLGCYLDYSSSATFLDGTLLQTPNTGDSSDKRPVRKPLANLHIVGTQSKPSKVYRLWYMFAADELTEDSKLYVAMVAKYGEPSEKNPPNEMRWRSEDTKLKASCERDHCEIIVEDGKFEELERRKQEEADGQARRQNAPDAPKL